MTDKSLKTAGFLALAIFVGTPAYAEPDATPITAAPADRSAQPDTGPTIEFLALQGDGVATFKLQGGGGSDNLDANSGVLRTRDSQWQVTFSAPLNEDGDTTDIATLDSLASGFKLELGFAKKFQLFGAPSSSEMNDRLEVARARCRANARGDRKLEEICATRPADETLFEDYGVGVNVHKGTTKVGLSAAIGYDNFKYRDPATLVKNDVNKFSYSGGVYLSHLFGSGETSLTGQIKYEVGYEAADKRILCPGNPTNIVIECFNTPDAPPTRDKSLLASFDLRQYLGDDLGFPVAIAPLVTYDISDDVLGVDVPLYLVGNGEAGLSGGVRVGWRSDTDDAVVGIFIGKTFGHATQD